MNSSLLLVSLPNEIIWKILTFLPQIEDQLALASTCRLFWNNVFKLASRLILTSTCYSPRLLSGYSHLSFLSQRYVIPEDQQKKSLKWDIFVTSWMTNQPLRELDFQVRDLPRRCRQTLLSRPTLRRLLQPIDADDISFVCDKIEELHLIVNSSVFLSHLTSLQHLTLSLSSTKSFVKREHLPPNLKTLHLNVYFKHTLSVLSGMESLKNLEITVSLSRNFVSNLEMFSSWVCLRHLIIRCGKVDFNFVRPLLDKRSSVQITYWDGQRRKQTKKVTEFSPI